MPLPSAPAKKSVVKKALPARKTTRKKPAPLTRIFVLDTNVLLHDPNCIFKFAEHDVYVPFVTLEELDGKKAGNQDVNRNARQATRLLEDVVSQPGYNMTEGFPLADFNGRSASGKLFVQGIALPFLPNEHLHKNDNLYLSVLSHLTKQNPGREVRLVTKDLNLRIKARAMDFLAEDYRHDHAVEDSDLLYRGWRILSTEQWEVWSQDMDSWQDGRKTMYRVPKEDLRINEHLVLATGEMLRVTSVGAEGAVLTRILDRRMERNAVLKVRARNDEQRAALELLMDPEVDMVALLGPAGTGKTLLALAAALAQVKDKLFDRIMFTRATTPVGEEIGFLPGTEEEKMMPWMGALSDNMEVLCEMAGHVEGQKLRELSKEITDVRAMTFMRGRTLNRRVVILDEAQNLTPKQMKTLITRAGEGTKLIVMGNLAQIDSPYLSETSSGLSYLVERFKDWPHFGAVILEHGERSRLANEGNDRL